MNREEAEKFLAVLAPTENQFTFQTIDDNKERAATYKKAGKPNPLSGEYHGTLAQHWHKLVKKNEAGAGIYVTVNRTDLNGRKAENITAIRAVFVDLDGAPLEPAKEWKPPHIIVQTSPGKWHVYWRVKDFPIEEFTDVQKLLYGQFDADKLHDLPRVMRLPGFLHQKAEPFEVKLLHAHEELEDYTIDDIVPEHLRGSDGKDDVDDEVRSSGGWQASINEAALKNLAAWVPALWPKAKQTSKGGYRISSKMLGRDNEEDLSIDPEGIVDFGIHDTGDKREGKRTAIDVVVEYGEMEFTEAVAWLCEKLGITKEDKGQGITTDDFYAYLEMHKFIFTPTGALWPAASVDGLLRPIPVGRKGKKIKASQWLTANRHVEQLTWAPGHPLVLENSLVMHSGQIEHRQDVNSFNLYRGPSVALGRAENASPWLEHCHKVFGDDADHIIKWCAQRVQQPHVKCNHALVLGSNDHGIGKDTMLEPVKHAVGPWNFSEVSAAQVLGRFNPFLKSVILRLNEARDMGDFNRYQFYDHMKSYIAAPPDVLRIDEKYTNEYYIFNCVGVIITSNYKTNGLYLPVEDRRHYVAWSPRKRDDFDETYWNRLWKWYEQGGYGHVAAYLTTLDISAWDPKAPPKRTEAFWAIVDSNQSPEGTELMDLLDACGNPPVFSLAWLIEQAEEKDLSGSFAEWLRDRKNRRAIPQRLEKCGYVPLRAEGNHGLWVCNKVRQTMYMKTEMTVRDGMVAVKEFINEQEERFKRMH